MNASKARIASLVVLAVLLAASLPIVGGSAAGDAPRRAVDRAAPFRFFSAHSVWNRRLGAQAPLDPSSPAVIANFVGEVEAERHEGRGPGINTTEWSVPIYTVRRDQPRVSVALRSRPMRIPAASLQEAWESVPLPRAARPAAGTDRPLVVYQPSSGTLWEFWELRRTSEGPKAAWGGAIADVAHSSGAYGPGAWPGADGTWGASASGLSIVGGLVTFEDWRRGDIDHALAMAIPEVRAGVYSSPARRTDGSSPNPLALPEGAHLRLDPHLDLAALHLPYPTLLLARAAQRYGIVVRDHAGIVVFNGEDPSRLRHDPYLGPHGFFDGYLPGEIMAAFPWDHLQLLKMRLRGSN